MRKLLAPVLLLFQLDTLPVLESLGYQKLQSCYGYLVLRNVLRGGCSFEVRLGASIGSAH